MSLPRHAPASCQAQLGRGGMATCRRTSDMNRSPLISVCSFSPANAVLDGHAVVRLRHSPRPSIQRTTPPPCSRTYGSRAALRGAGSSGGNQGAGREGAVTRLPSRRSQPVQPNRRSIVPSAMTVPQAGERIRQAQLRAQGYWLPINDHQLDKAEDRGSPWAACRRRTQHRCPAWRGLF